MRTKVVWAVLPLIMATSHALRVITTTDTPEAANELLNVIRGPLSGSQILQEKIQSYYWWDGKVANELELRLSFNTLQPMVNVLSQLGDAHNYDVPMIIANSEDENGNYWKGVLSSTNAPQLAEKLAASRLVACAQIHYSSHVSHMDSLTVKTTAQAKAAVEELAPDISWSMIVGNTEYLEWVDAETRESAQSIENVQIGGFPPKGKAKELVAKQAKEL